MAVRYSDAASARAPKLRHHLTQEGAVIVSLALPHGGAPVSATFTVEAARAFAWGLLADIDPVEAQRAGAPRAAFGDGVAVDRKDRKPGWRARAVLALSPSRQAVLARVAASSCSVGTKTRDLAEQDPPMKFDTCTDAMGALLKRGLVVVIGGRRGGGGGYEWRRTAAGDALISGEMR